MQHAGQPLTRTLDPGCTLFSGAEIRVVLLPVGEAPEAVFQRYASLIVRHRQVELQNVRSFYKEAQKSPFKFFPWKTGNMHFKFLPEDAALQPSPLAPLHNHRRVLGVIGVMHCPHVEDVAKAYAQFEQRCKAFPDAFTVRCFAFEPSDEQIAEDRKRAGNFIMFPPGDWEQLDNHAEVVMHDFAACLLAELERWMLNASPAMVDLATLVDSPEFTGAGGALEAVQTRLYSDEELKTKKRYGRLQKAMGDYCLLAGSPLDAQDHYSTAAELGRTAQDWVYLAAALEGYAAAKALNAAITNGGFAINQSSVFNDEEQWRTPRRETPPADADPDGNLSEASRSSSAFGGAQFWGALRSEDKLEGEVRGLFAEAKASYRRRGGQPLLVENDLKLARFLAGLHASGARREVSELVSQLQLAAEALPLPEDRLLTFVEGAQALGLVGSTRKRVLLLWQAVELSKFLGFPNARTLEVARKALEPPDDPQEPEPEPDGAWEKRRPLSQSAVPRSWPQVRAGCLEAVLGLAIYAKQHADVWDAAAALLREHSGELSSHRMQSLLENLLAAASQMAPADKARPGPGPPPLLFFLAPRPPPLPQRPVHFSVGLRRPGRSALTGRQGSGPFLYDPFSAKREQAAAKSQAAATGPVEWVCGEVASVEVEVSNPAAVGMRIDKLVLEATYLGDASMAPKEYMTITSTTQAAWKPRPVSLNIPAGTQPVRIVLEGTPLLKGMLVLTGCRLTSFGGVSWFQPWSKPAPSLVQQLGYSRRRDGGELSGTGGTGSSGIGGGGSEVVAAPEARVVVVEPLPLVQLSLQPGDGPAGGAQEAPDGLGMLPATAGSSGDAATAAAAGGGAAAAAAGTAAGARQLRLLQGQVYTAQLTVTNTSKAPVGWASINIRQKDPSSRLVVAADGAALQDQMPLMAGQSCSIPVTFAVGVRSSHAPEEVFSAEICLEYVSREAAGPLLSVDSPVATPGGSNQAVLGRHAVLPVEVHVQPSLQVAAVQFREIYLPAGAAVGAEANGSAGLGAAASTAGAAGTAEVAAGAAEGSSSSGGGSGDLAEGAAAEGGTLSSSSSSTVFEQRCVMEVSVANRGRWPLQVWLGRAIPDPTHLAAAAERDLLLPPQLPPAAEGLPASGLLAPGRRCTVAYILDDATCSSSNGSQASSGVLGAAAGGGGAPAARLAASFEEQQRQECAERLCRAVALFYRVDAEDAGIADAALGTAPLVHGEVFNGLTYRSLALLQPCAITVRLSAEPLPFGAAVGSGSTGPGDQQQAAAALQLMEAPEAEQQQQVAAAAYGRFPAVSAALGQPVCVTLSVTNHGRTVPGAGKSPRSSTVDDGSGSGGDLSAAQAAAAADALELHLDAAVACQPVRGSEQEEAAAAAAIHELSAVWAGQLWTGLRLTVPPGQAVSQRLGLCLLAPGLYQIGLQHWKCRTAAQAAAAAAEANSGGQQQQQQQQSKKKKSRAPPGPLQNTMVAVQPCFVLAVAGQ